jgi:ribosomal protein S19E (S16A)
MREDMFKVIVERPRKWKSDAKAAYRQRRDLEGPPQLGMRAGYGYRALNENLNPLRRYLRAQVGRPWDKVYSEIAHNIDRRNTVQQHIYQHLADFVAIKVAREDGQLVDLTHNLAIRRSRALRQELYVDPRTGLLRVNKDYGSWRRGSSERTAAWQAKIDARRRVLDELTQLHLLDGEWYEVRFARVPASVRPSDAIFDVVMKRAIPRAGDDLQKRQDLYGSYRVYAISKRQLSRREKKHYRVGMTGN